MKLIFSRKGFDSAAGGVPSPLVEGRPISLPIPTRMPTPLTYGDLPEPLPTLVEHLTKGRLGRNTPCHLDPDLDTTLRPRRSGWRGALGQVGAAQSHLAGQDVGEGDLFLFWGLFRPVEEGAGGWRFTGPREHRLFGWLQVGEVLPLGPDGNHATARYPWLDEHPHARSGWGDNNTLYLATDRLTLGGIRTAAPGFGLSPVGRRLTAPESALPSLWQVPDWLNPSRGGVGMTYHPPERFGADGTLRSAARGQEFVADIAGRPDAMKWLRDLFSKEPS